MIITVILFLTRAHVKSFQVISGPLAKNRTYTALAVREETIVTADAGGYITYYARENSKVKKYGAVYSVSPNAQISEESELSDDSLRAIGSDVRDFSASFEVGKFNDTYSFKNRIEGRVLDNSLLDTSDLAEMKGKNSVTIGSQTIATSPSDGIVSYTLDGYEGFDIKGITPDDMDRNSYKQTVLPYCTRISDAARRIGCVNTLVRRPDGWHGYNTDYDGFRYLLAEGGIDPAGKKALILGNGGASLTARTALADLGASGIVILSRSVQAEHPVRIDTYDRIGLYAEAEIVVNTTPVGMYPGNGEKPVDLKLFPKCRGAADVIYNPARTAFLLQAEELGIPHRGGLGMLTAQARRSAELWLDTAIPDRKVKEVTAALEKEMRNIALVGMPGCGKTSIGRALKEKTGRIFFDTDEMVEQRTGRKIPDILAEDGEEAFRRLETAALEEAGRESGCIIATGGGCVTKERNDPLLHQNSTVVWIRRDLRLLPADGRPLSASCTAEALYEQRKDRYAEFADLTVENNDTVEDAAERILEKLERS